MIPNARVKNLIWNYFLSGIHLWIIFVLNFPNFKVFKIFTFKFLLDLELVSQIDMIPNIEVKNIKNNFDQNFE